MGEGGGVGLGEGVVDVERGGGGEVAFEGEGGLEAAAGEGAGEELAQSGLEGLPVAGHAEFDVGLFAIHRGQFRRAAPAGPGGFASSKTSHAFHAAKGGRVLGSGNGEGLGEVWGSEGRRCGEGAQK